MVAFILFEDLKHYTVKEISHYPKNHLVSFEFVSMNDKPDINMRIRYMKLAAVEDNIYMIGSVECANSSVMVTAVAEKALEKFGEITTRNLYSFYKERRAGDDKKNVG